jgi:cytochrome bd-type quinol oxidase subunit 2
VRGVLPRTVGAPALELFKILVVCLLIAIVISLGSALFHLVNDKGDSKRMVRALTVRIGLSVALFLLIMGAWALGIISPHGVQP